MTTEIATRRRKSEKLTSAELKGLEELVKKEGTQLDAALYIGIHISVLNRIRMAGSGSPENIEKVRTALQG